MYLYILLCLQLQSIYQFSIKNKQDITTLKMSEMFYMSKTL